MNQQVNLRGLGSNPGADKLDSGFQLSVKLVPALSGVNVHCPGLRFTLIHLEGGDEVDPTMARKINLSI